MTAPGSLPDAGTSTCATRCCPDRRKCWARTDAEDRPGRAPTSDEREQDGSIFWPWIGEQYAVGGVCLVGITPNMDDNSWWLIALEYDIEWHAVAGLGAGKERTPGTSPFHSLPCCRHPRKEGDGTKCFSLMH